VSMRVCLRVCVCARAPLAERLRRCVRPTLSPYTAPPWRTHPTPIFSTSIPHRRCPDASPHGRRQEHASCLDLVLHIRPCPREALFSHLGPPLQPEGETMGVNVCVCLCVCVCVRARACVCACLCVCVSVSYVCALAHRLSCKCHKHGRAVCT